MGARPPAGDHGAQGRRRPGRRPHGRHRRLDPEDADFRFLLGAIHFDERRFEEALRAADAGLAIEPEHDGCTNLRVMALVKRGQVTGQSVVRGPTTA